MRRWFALWFAFAFLFALSACGADRVSIEGHQWKLERAMGGGPEAASNPDEFVIAVGEADELYPNAEPADLTLTAQNGELTVTDATRGKTYAGTYLAQKKTPDGTIYQVTIDGVSGYATAALTEHGDGSKISTLPINLGEYSLYFYPAA